MQIQKNISSPFTTQEELRAGLLSRIPENRRAQFFSPAPPGTLTAELHGLDEGALAAAKNRLQTAIEKQEKVLIFGDYDCDGVTATAVLWETLAESGLTARPFLPHRERHGYGLSVTALEEIFSEYQPDLVVTVDNGIVAHEAFAWLKEKGVDTILTDHHTSDGTVPPADIVVHSTQLAGVTVAWMLAHALNPESAATKLDYAVLGTLADQVPLYGANRSFALHGLAALRNTQRRSLLALAEAAGTRLSEATAETVHFLLAPRINAMGRLGDAMDALRALVSKQPERTHQLVKALQETNRSRQELTSDLYEEVISSLSGKHEQEHLVVVSGEFHEGIIGLLASKIVDTTHKPAIVISTLGETAKASVRSVPGVNIVEFLRDQAESVPYVALGGHAMAAGFSIPLDTLETTQRHLETAARATISPDLLVPSIEVIGALDWSLLRGETLLTLQEFAPFGAGNETPSFLLEDIEIRDYRPVGRDGSHWLLTLADPRSGLPTKAIYFRAAEKITEPLHTYRHAVVELSPSNYRGKDVDIVVRAVLAG
ncbi:DHH family phosphoesterase [Candidatus Woesebacteria bacterium]|nr:DHH family phosphoesterase [Candidatus Woesebacteria bacterium]MCD8506819.1 DHH family phosphoesterase [Candidatus Woesebacteria bacterium]MCD8527563.1 DHH family phosphoesterase [Candidatus Woesebacteria bacterium]MCD8546303.1 DHH family phosphoesterase [Candidatus Woesebacteria bacterium]